MTAFDATQTATRRAALDAHGALREALSACANLEQLLHSRNVGPKAVASVLPDVVVACPGFLERLEPFWLELRSTQFRDCAQGASDLLTSRIDELEQCLAKAQGKPLGAGPRLRLEGVVRRVLRDLGGMLPLLELMGDLLSPREEEPLDWIEALALSRTGDQSHPPGASVVSGVLVTECESAPVKMSPRVALNVLRSGAALVHDANTPTRLFFTATERGHRLSIDRKPDAGRAVALVLPRVVSSTEACLTTAAGVLHLDVKREADAVSFEWS